MLIESLTIKNFRGIAEATLELDPSMTVLVGANNAGKTTVLDALQAVLTFRRGAPSFLDTDFRAEESSADVRDAKPIEVFLRVGPSAPPSFEPGELGKNGPDVADGREFVRLRLRARYSSDLQQIDTRLVRLREDNKPVDDEGFGAFPWRELLTFRAFGADRDLQRGMGGRWSDWSQILSQVRPDQETLNEVKVHFEQGSNILVDRTSKLEEIGKALRPVGEALGMPGSEVKLSATPQDPAELLQRIMVELRLAGAPRTFSAERHGHGTQGALLFALYRLQVQWILASSPPGASAILTVEEPESHLHPTAQRAMAEEIRQLPGQVVATSHSPEFVNSALGRLALLRAVGGNSSIQSVITERSLLQDHPRALFARALMITEGNEGRMLPWFAQALGVKLHEVGIEILDAGGQANILKLWKFFGPDGLGLPTVCLADADNRNFLNSFLKKNGSDPIPADPEDIRPDEVKQTLSGHGYYICPYGECLEQELARCAPEHIDVAFNENRMPTFQEWRQTTGTQELKDTWKKKLSANVTNELTDSDARAVRLARWKDGPEHVARLMTIDGTDASLIPDRFKEALRRAEALARSQTGTP